MKRWIVVILIMIMAIPAIAQDYPVSAVISTNSIVIAPDRRDNRAIDSNWVHGTAYSQGDRVISTNGLLYWAVTAGTSTNAPSGVTADFTADALTWRYIPTDSRSRPIPREILEIVSLSSNNIFFAVGFGAVVNKGIVLTGSGGSLTYNGQYALYAISASTNETITIQDR